MSQRSSPLSRKERQSRRVPATVAGRPRGAVLGAATLLAAAAYAALGLVVLLDRPTDPSFVGRVLLVLLCIGTAAGILARRRPAWLVGIILHAVLAGVGTFVLLFTALMAASMEIDVSDPLFLGPAGFGIAITLGAAIGAIDLALSKSWFQVEPNSIAS